MRQQNVKSPDANATALPRPLSRAAAALSKVLSRAWSLPPQRNRVAVERDLKVPMSDGTILLADHYLPVSVASAATVLVRCPYGRSCPFGLQNAQILAERGYHVLMQSCRGTFGSGGEFEPMRNEIADGQDTVAWLREQNWFDGRLATYGASYLGFVQWALAMDPPPELVAAMVQVGPHDFSRSAYRHGVFDLYNFLGWGDLIAHQENTGLLQGAVRNATAERRLRPVLDRLPVRPGVRDLLGRRADLVRELAGAPGADRPVLGAAAVRGRPGADHGPGPGGGRLAGPVHRADPRAVPRARRPGRAHPAARRAVGPPGHRDQGRRRVAESLAWLDRYAGPGNGARPARHRPLTRTARCASGSAARARGSGARSPAGRRPAPRSSAGTSARMARSAPGSRPPEVPAASFRYDPADPTPSPGGAILAVTGGSRDNRAVERRLDVLVFSSDPLDEPVEVVGEVAAELSVTRDNPYADLFVRLCDVNPRGRSRNVCDGIVRLTGQDPLAGTVRVSLIGAAHRFGRGHRIRLQVAGGAHPRFARNPGNGQVDAAAEDLVPTQYDDRPRRPAKPGNPPRCLLLPVAEA